MHWLSADGCKGELHPRSLSPTGSALSVQLLHLPTYPPQPAQGNWKHHVGISGLIRPLYQIGSLYPWRGLEVARECHELWLLHSTSWEGLLARLYCSTSLQLETPLFWALLETLFSPALNQMFPQPSPHRSVYRYYIWVYRQSVILGIPSCIVTLIQPALFFMSETHKVNHTLAPSGLWIANNSKRCQ